MNKTQLYFFALGLALFCLPIVLVLIISPYIFPSSFISDAAKYIPSKEDLTLDYLSESPKVIRVSRGASFAQVASDISLDPNEGKNFLVSFIVKFEGFPQAGVRQNILTKYEANKKPYPGWSIAVKNLSTSLRLQVYWQGYKGNGGWYSFDDLNLQQGVWYALSLILSEDKSVVLLVEDLEASKVYFAGGRSFDKIEMPITNSDLVLGSNRTGKRAFKGEVAQILFANPEKLPEERAKLISLVKDGPSSLRSKLAEDEINLWIAESGKDESRFAREITLVGSAQWLPDGQKGSQKNK